MKFSRRL